MAWCVGKKDLPEIGDVVTKVELDDDKAFNTPCTIMFKSGKGIVCQVMDSANLDSEEEKEIDIIENYEQMICDECKKEFSYEKPSMPKQEEQRVIYTILCPNKKCSNSNKKLSKLEFHNMTPEEYNELQYVERKPGQAACQNLIIKGVVI